MIHIRSIEAEDTFSYRKLSFNFQSGLHSIEGANGSSKTSIFLALIHCLANKNPKGCKVDDVSNKITGKPYAIKVRAEKDGHEYVFVNSKKSGTVEIWRDGKDISLKRIPDNLKLIQEILGADFMMLCDLLYQSKDSTLDLLETGTDRGRKVFVNRVLKLSEVDDQLQRMKDKEKELAGKNGRIAALVKQVETLESTLGELHEEGEELETFGTECEIATISNEVCVLSEKRREMEADLRAIQLEIATAEGEQATRKKIAALEASHIPPLLDSIEDTQAELENAQAECQAIKINANSLRQELTRAEKAKSQLALLSQYRISLMGLEKPDKDRGECEDQLDKIIKVHASTKAKLEEVHNKLTPYRKALKNKVCPTCGSAENWERISQLVKDLEQEQGQHEALIKRCEDGKEKYKQRLILWGRRERIETEIARLSMIAPVDLDIPVAERRLRSYDKKVAQLEENIASMKQTVIDYHKAKELEGQIDKLKATLKGTELSEGLYLSEDTIQLELNITAGLLGEKGLRLNSLKERLDLAKEHNAAIRARREVNRMIAERNTQIALQLSQAKLELADAERRLDLVREWVGILGNKGYRVARIKKFLQSLNATMSKYSQIICDGRIKSLFFINDDGEIELLISDAAKEMEYPLWSNGEKARVKLICLFAVLELLEVMGSVSFNVLCLDEVFDALDAEGKEGLFKVLDFLKQRGKALYVIAHSELALDLSYDSVIRAVKHQDGTTEIFQ